MKAETYLKKTARQLEKIAWRHFSKFIRERDSENGFFKCISCGETKSTDQLQAGHYYPAGKFKSIKFDEFNVNGECVHDNYYSGDHLIKYKENLIKKIGINNFDLLQVKADYSKRHPFKQDKFLLIDLITRYKNRN